MKKQDHIFDKVIATRASTHIVDQIKTAIITGKLSAGSRLPSQRELQEVFNVSRPVVTESLRVLEKMGLVQVKRGVNGGSFVSNGTQARLSELLQVSFQLNEIPIRDLVEFREHMEMANARWSSERRTEDDLRALEDILAAMKKLIDEKADWNFIIEQDSLFHLELAKAAKNKLSHIFLKVIWYNMLNAGQHHVLASRALEIHASLQRLFEAVKNRDGDEASRIMVSHILNFNIDIIQPERSNSQQ